LLMDSERDHELPLTERPGARAEGLGADELLIRRLVDSFYGQVRADPLLGPIFESNVSDWSVHLPKMYDFWSSLVLRTGRYSGRPIREHLKLEGLGAEHFERWLALWRATVMAEAPPAARAAFIQGAERMAANMRAAILGS